MTLYPIAEKRSSKINDTNILEILDIIKPVLTENHVLVSFDVVSMFPDIDTRFGLKHIKDALFDDNFDLDYTVVDALEI